MRFQGRCYRGHDPRWSFTPISGKGAEITGGRFNRVGEPTLYLSLDIVTSVGECTQGLTRRLEPLTMCEYEVDCEPIADLRDDGGRASHGVTLPELACPWMSHLLNGEDAPSWLVVDDLKEQGFVGMLAPSFYPGATPDNCNLILWGWGPKLPAKVEVFDPANKLPKDQLSWS